MNITRTAMLSHDVIRASCDSIVTFFNTYMLLFWGSTLLSTQKSLDTNTITGASDDGLQASMSERRGKIVGSGEREEKERRRWSKGREEGGGGTERKEMREREGKGPGGTPAD